MQHNENVNIDIYDIGISIYVTFNFQVHLLERPLLWGKLLRVSNSGHKNVMALAGISSNKTLNCCYHMYHICNIMMA